jgi:hypothetical protein
MNAILKKENVYIAIKNEDLRNGVNSKEVESLIYDYNDKDSVYLYGGRVSLHYGSAEDLVNLEVDGIQIQEVYHKDSSLSFKKNINLSKAAAFLNQMENLGIDPFLENYRNQLRDFKKELEIKAEKIEQEQSVQFDEDRLTFLTSLKKFINELTCIIFCLLINMNAGLDNQYYSDAYNEIINLYF